MPLENLTRRTSITTKRACALGIMAKSPFAGGVKTRLTPPLTSTEAATLSACFLRDTANNIDGVDGDGIIVYTPVGDDAAFAELVPENFQGLAQRGESLGDRLLNATADLLDHGYQSVCLINSDSPTLPRSILNSTIEALTPEGDRLVLGPAEDGGYYLIGLKRPHEILFERIAWSTSEVLAHTLERAGKISLEVVMLPKWYDVDDAATLKRLCGEFFQPNGVSDNGHSPYAAPFTREYLAALLKEDKGRRFSFRWQD